MVVLLVALLAFVVVLALRPRTDRSPDGFARAHGLQLDDETRAFVTFHLARVHLHRQLGAIVGLLAGFVVQDIAPGGVPTASVTMLGGSVVGLSVAELARWVPACRSPRRVASLQPRARATYLSARSRWLDRLTAILLALAGGAALWQNGERRSAVAVMTGAGVVVLAANRAIGGRIARRAAPDGSHPNLAAADRAVRVASVDVLATLVASLVLCVVTWLVLSAAPVRNDVVLGGRHVFALPEGAVDVTTVLDGTSVEISWRSDDATRSTAVPLPAGVTAVTSFGVEPRRPARNAIAVLVAVLTGGWAFGEWLQVSRVAFAREPSRSRRRAAVAA